jgi:hypothetical protein
MPSFSALAFTMLAARGFCRVFCFTCHFYFFVFALLLFVKAELNYAARLWLPAKVIAFTFFPAGKKRL